MTDPALVFCTTLILVSFWRAFHSSSVIPAEAGISPSAGKIPASAGMTMWGYLFFIGCGFGLLAKGPVALVLAGLPVFFWVLIRRQWKPLWQKLPWIRGGLLMLAIALPWYLLAEQRTPGFLQYFIVGENIGRFLDPHWKGDRYGFAHAYPYGMIWLFVIAGLFPWCFIVLRWFKTRLTDKDGWLLYLVLWSATSPLFFTFAANIIWPYCLIMQPGFALLFAEIWTRTGKPESKYFPAIASLTTLAGLIAIIAFTSFPAFVGEDQKDVIAAWKKTSPASDSALIFWSNRMEFSAAFYSGGRARSTEDPTVLDVLLHNEIRDCLVTYDYNENTLPEKVRAAFKEVGRFKNKRGLRILLCEL
jgi:4-amino-4-deoxy-L-arabinose transferase-like glycosyltransferase